MLRFALLVAGIAACREPSAKTAFESTARQLNPIILILKPAAAMVLAATDDDAALRACASADPQLDELMFLRVYDRALQAMGNDAHERFFELPFRANRLRPTRRRIANRLHKEYRSKMCRDGWRDLIDEVEKLRRYAAEEGVEVVSLEPSPRREP